MAKIQLLLVAVISCCSVPAHADEMWTCTMSGASTREPVVERYALHDKQFTKVGVDIVMYNVVANTQAGIVALAATAYDPKMIGLPGTSKTEIGTSIFLINRASGEAKSGEFWLGQTKTYISQGYCRRNS